MARKKSKRRNSGSGFRNDSDSAESASEDSADDSTSELSASTDEPTDDVDAVAADDLNSEPPSNESTDEPLAAPPDATSSGPTTIIGSTVTIRGKLKSDEDLVVHGRIEAEITSSKDLRIEASGIVNADVGIRSVTVSGILVGDVHGTDRVELAPTARFVGDIHTPRLIVNDGASFRGGVIMDGLDHLEASRPDTRAAAVPKNAWGAPLSSPLAGAGLLEQAVAEAVTEPVEPVEPAEPAEVKVGESTTGGRTDRWFKR